MSKRKAPFERPVSPSSSRKSAEPAGPEALGWFSAAAIRETVESFVIALILAFLVRTFEAEAFVIPTGSMAPTLMGRHKDVVCPECGYPFRVSASEELDSKTGEFRGSLHMVDGGTCPMCRYPVPLGPGNPQHKSYPSFSGDRILVGKFLYQFVEPQRWDVPVFKYPDDAKVNYIKRLVGLPGETVRLSGGDVFIRRSEDDDFHIARKSDTPKKLLTMLQAVYDTAYADSNLLRLGWPHRWQSDEPGQKGAWTNSADDKGLSTDGTAAQTAWVRYRHFVPTAEDWQRLLRRVPLGTVQPELIRDFAAYNTQRTPQRPYGTPFNGHWVGDLAVETELHVERPAGKVIFELIKAGRWHRCTINLETGAAEMSIEGLENFHPQAATAIRGAGVHRVMFSNIDDELLLWHNRSVVRFDGPTSYPRPQDMKPFDADFTPVAIGAQGAAVRAEPVAIYRDIYYIPVRGGAEGTQVEFQLQADQFLMFGDNSAFSSDSRFWGPVDRNLLIGKALFIYWPHSWDAVQIGSWSIPFPFFPNVARMGPVH